MKLSHVIEEQLFQVHMNTSAKTRPMNAACAVIRPLTISNAAQSIRDVLVGEAVSAGRTAGHRSTNPTIQQVILTRTVTDDN